MKPVPLVRRDPNTDIGRWFAHLDVKQFRVRNTGEEIRKEQDCFYIQSNTQSVVLSMRLSWSVLNLSMAQ